MSRRRTHRGSTAVTVALAVVVILSGSLLYRSAGGWAVFLAIVVTLALLGLSSARGGRKRSRRRPRARR